MTPEEVQALRAQANLFEQAAQERLQVLERSDALLKAAIAENEELRAQLAAARADAGRWKEESRGAREVAEREKAAAARVLELENEGLLDSILRHWRRGRNSRA
ncbi:MAG: hypothetical protein FJW30_00410 [Acidobacteria bacterium]|nr:hypothetical protein [Acidobacteriota bacterium]